MTVPKIYTWPNEQPSPPLTATWIKMSDAYGFYWACGACGNALPRIRLDNSEFNVFPILQSVERTLYCPYCGVRTELRSNN